MSIFVDAGKRFELRITCNVIKNTDGEVLCYKMDPNGKCEICDNYIGSNNKALTNHKRSCKLKHQQIALPITLISIEEPTTPTVAITTPIPKKKLKK